jgi:hypothetical protein
MKRMTREGKRMWTNLRHCSGIRLMELIKAMKTFTILEIRSRF